MLIMAVILIIFLIIKHHNKSVRYQKEIFNAQLEIQEQTFQHISQEIHDNIGQVLTLAKLNLNTISQELPGPSADKTLQAKQLVSKAIADLRNLSKSLNTDLVQDVGLYQAIQRELNLLSKTGQYTTSFDNVGAMFRFDKQKELILFRIFQELLNNIVNHSKATRVGVKTFYKPESFGFSVEDNGQGFDAGRMNSEPGFGLGLRNMQRRALLIGAQFQIKSMPGKGTVATIELPLSTFPRT